MESSLIIKYEYFELVKKLNQSNKLKNQETDLYFYIDSADADHLKLFAAISASQKILLCHKNHGSNWTESGFSKYPNLESHIAELLRKSNAWEDLTNYIKSHVFELPD
ncbi:MAG: hypothetical protein AABY53_03550 [Bdellovibrionota bacterium]